MKEKRIIVFHNFSIYIFKRLSHELENERVGGNGSQDYCLLKSVFCKTDFIVPHHIRLHFYYHIFSTLKKKSILLIFFKYNFKNTTEFSRHIAENCKTTRTRKCVHKCISTWQSLLWQLSQVYSYAYWSGKS